MNIQTPKSLSQTQKWEKEEEKKKNLKRKVFGYAF